jgi:hypothetical protein
MHKRTVSNDLARGACLLMTVDDSSMINAGCREPEEICILGENDPSFGNRKRDVILV